MSEAKKKLLGLFKNRTTPQKDKDRDRLEPRPGSGSPGGDSLDRGERRRRRDPDRPRKPRSGGSRSLSPHHHSGRDHDGPRTSNTDTRTSRSSRSKSRGADSPPHASPRRHILAQWPPPGFSTDVSLTQAQAIEYIAGGVPIFEGVREAVQHASEDYYALYATCGKGDGNGHEDHNDCAGFYTSAFSAATLRLAGPGTPKYPWETLERPSMAFCYGNAPGTITLNQWVGLSGKSDVTIEMRDVGMRPRELELYKILERLIELESGFGEENIEELRYRNLYKLLLRDPDKKTSPHRGMEKQIADLIIVLSRKEWVDFSRAENQVVAKFFTNATFMDEERFKPFFHQLLLSTELDYRIHSKHHADWAKEKLLAQLPPKISWDLALARRWRECMGIERFVVGEESGLVKFDLRAKKRQVKALRRFARAMKWPNLAQVDALLKDREPPSGPVELRSSDAMSYFTGMILPGRTLPWLLMNTLIDCDDDAATSALNALSHLYPHSGFQYKSTTYWSSSSIVGKVLGPTCHEIAGWIGPARPARDLGRIQIARIRQRKPRLVLSSADVQSMTLRSDPLGPPSEFYPVSEYSLLLPDTEDIVDTVRIEKLALRPVPGSAPISSPKPSKPKRKLKRRPSVSSSSSSITKSGEEKENTGQESDDEENIPSIPLTYDAAVQFAINGRSWPLRLSYDVSFISAAPCFPGTHVLFFDYVYKAVRVDDILTIRDWGVPGGASSSSRKASTTGPGGSNSGLGVGDRDSGNGTPTNGLDDDNASETSADSLEKVLVVEAFGVSDNEVLARAWCAHWGLSAVVADLRRTCLSCAIREAYAACVNVVIAVVGAEEEEEDE